MTAVGLLTLPLIVGVIAGLISDFTTGIAVALSGLLAMSVSLVVLTPGRGRDIAAGGAVSDAAAGWAEFHRELARARRFDRPFAIARLDGASLDNSAALTELRDAVAAAARRTDRAWVDGDDVLVLLPETTPAAAARFIERISAATAERVSLQPSLATFPDDGITSGALIAVAYGGAAVVPTPIGAVRADARAATTEPEPATTEVLGHGG